MICFYTYLIFLEYLSEWTMSEHCCTIMKYIFHQNRELHSVQCVHSSSTLHILSLYSVITPAVNRRSCHSKVRSLQQCTSHLVTLQLVHSSSSLQILSQYSVITPAVNWTACHSTGWSLRQWGGSCHSIVCSPQQCTSRLVTLQLVHSTSSLQIL